MEDGGFDAAFLAVGAQRGKHADIPAGDSARILDAVTLLHETEDHASTRARAPRRRLRRRRHRHGRRPHGPPPRRRGRRRRLPAHPGAHAGQRRGGAGRRRRGRPAQVALDHRRRRRARSSRSSGWSSTPTASRSRPARSRSCRRTRSCWRSARRPTSRCSAGSPRSRSPTGLVPVGADMMTARPGVFAGGDMVAGARTLTDAIGHGKRAARAIDAWLARPQPRSVRPATSWPRPSTSTPGTTPTRRTPVRPRLEAARRTSTFDEVVGGLDESTALFEARRCMSCGNCFQCDNCFGVCPDNAVHEGRRGARLPLRLRLLQGLRPVRAGVPLRGDRDGARRDLTRRSGPTTVARGAARPRLVPAAPSDGVAGRHAARHLGPARHGGLEQHPPLGGRHRLAHRRRRRRGSPRSR